MDENGLLQSVEILYGRFWRVLTLHAPISGARPPGAPFLPPGMPVGAARQPRRKVDDAEHITTAKRMKADGHTGKDIAKYLGVSRATLYRYLTEDTAA